METGLVYLQSVQKQFLAYKTLGEKCFDQLTEEELNRQPAPGSNSITTIVRHMHGNLLSRFTNFLTEDGEKPWRKRDEEFNPDIAITKNELIEHWNEGWNCLFSTLNNLQPEDLLKTVMIRHEPHSAMDAINRQLAHHCSHVGQIILLGKLYRQEGWQSLSIPVGQSGSFNEKMAQKR